MASQTLISDVPVSVSSRSVTTTADANASRSGDAAQSRWLEAMKKQYRLDQQEKFLHLQAETECLLQQLQAIKQQRQSQADVVVATK